MSSNKEIIKIILLNIAVFVFICVALGITVEIYYRISEGTKITGKDISLTREPTLGWDSIPKYTELSGTGNSTIMFIGDSFTQNITWQKAALEILAKKGHSVAGYSFGVSGYGTIQEYLKLREYINRFRPQVVVLLFFAWNDLPDNCQYPAMFYNYQTRSRPYYSFSTTPPAITKPSMAPNWVIESKIYQRLLFPCIERAEQYCLRKFGYDVVASKRIPTMVSCGVKESWYPLYRPSKQDSPYVSSAWKSTIQALADMKQLVEVEYKAKLLVVGIDNAFTVDKDVYDTWVTDPNDFDITLPLTRLGTHLRELDIHYINALPHLQDLSKRISKKVYNGPEGNLSGHFEIEPLELLGGIVADGVEQWL